MIEWSGPASDATGIILVAEDQAEFGAAVVNEIDVDDEVADNSPHAYVARIEEHLSAAAALLAELRTQLDELEADGRLQTLGPCAFRCEYRSGAINTTRSRVQAEA